MPRKKDSITDEGFDWSSLLDIKDDQERENRNERTEQLIKALKNHAPLEEIKELVDKGINTHALDSEGRPLLVLVDSKEKLELLLEAGCDPNIRDEDGRSLLLYRFSPEDFKLLIDHGLDVNTGDHDVPDCIYQKPEIQKVFIENGLNLQPYLKQLSGYNSYQIPFDAERFFKLYEEDLKRREENCGSFMKNFIAGKDILLPAIQRRADLDARLFSAVKKNRPLSEIKALVKEGADPKIELDDYRDRTLLGYAKNPEVVEFLLKAGAEDTRNHFALASALRTNNLKKAEILLAHCEVDSYDANNLIRQARTAEGIFLVMQKSGPIVLNYNEGLTDQQFERYQKALDMFNKQQQKKKGVWTGRYEGKRPGEDEIQQAKRKKEMKRHLEEVRSRLPEDRVSGTVVANHIADDVIAGKERRTITREVGAELARKKRKELAKS